MTPYEQLKLKMAKRQHPTSIGTITLLTTEIRHAHKEKANPSLPHSMRASWFKAFKQAINEPLDKQIERAKVLNEHVNSGIHPMHLLKIERLA